MDRTIGRIIGLITIKCRGYFGEKLEKYNLTSAEQPFFMTLHDSRGITQEELTSIVCVDKAATTRAVRSLEKKGFLYRVQDENDRRRNLVYPTEKADRLWHDVKKELLCFNELLLKDIEPKDVETAYAVLQKIEENIKELSAGRTGSKRR